MKREFLQNFKVGDQPLPKEVIDEIMAENDRDIEAAKKPFADYETIRGQLEEAQKTIKGFEGQDIEGVRKSAAEWERKYNEAIAEHKKQMDDLAFDGVLKDAITAAKGRMAAAIIGALGPEKVAALKASKDQTADIKAALEGLKKDSGYLFESEQVPPPYSPGTGSQNMNTDTSKMNYTELCAYMEAHPGTKI